MKVPNKKLGFGLMRLPLDTSKNNGSLDMEKCRELVDTFMKEGFNYFDTAYVYHGGLSEVMFGELVAKRYPRDSFILTDKMPVFIIKEVADYERIFKEQLSRCKVDYFDYYFLHSLNHVSYYEKVQNHNAFEFLVKLKEQGYIKHIGFSFHDNASMLEKILIDHPEVELVQLQINYMDWENDVIESRKCYEVCKKYNKQVAIMEPLKGGKLCTLNENATNYLKKQSSDSLASWGLRFCGSLDDILVILSGMSNMEQLLDNIKTMKEFKPLSTNEQKIIEDVVNILKDSITIPCTACRYCIDGCPQNIDIPRYFGLYNSACQYGKMGEFIHMYHETLKKGGKPNDCIGCGTCEFICPQHIKIKENLKKVSEMFE